MHAAPLPSLSLSLPFNRTNHNPIQRTVLVDPNPITVHALPHLEGVP